MSDLEAQRQADRDLADKLEGTWPKRAAFLRARADGRVAAPLVPGAELREHLSQWHSGIRQANMAYPAVTGGRTTEDLDWAHNYQHEHFPSSHGHGPHGLTPAPGDARRCIECGEDLADVMGVMVFAGGMSTGALLCVAHGTNGRNGMSRERYESLLRERTGQA